MLVSAPGGTMSVGSAHDEHNLDDLNYSTSTKFNTFPALVLAVLECAGTYFICGSFVYQRYSFTTSYMLTCPLFRMTPNEIAHNGRTVVMAKPRVNMSCVMVCIGNSQRKGTFDFP